MCLYLSDSVQHTHIISVERWACVEEDCCTQNLTCIAHLLCVHLHAHRQWQPGKRLWATWSWSTDCCFRCVCVCDSCDCVVRMQCRLVSAAEVFCCSVNMRVHIHAPSQSSTKRLTHSAAVHAPQFFGHRVPRDQAVPRGHGLTVCAAQDAAQCGGQASCTAAAAQSRRVSCFCYFMLL